MINKSNFANLRNLDLIPFNTDGVIYIHGNSIDFQGIENFNITSAYSEGEGAGLYTHAIAENNITLTTATVRGNKAEANGGNIYAESTTASSNITLLNSNIVDGVAVNANGAGIYQKAHMNATMTLDNAKIQSNEIQKYGDGGGIYNYSEQGKALISINNSQVLTNKAMGNGGGIFNYSTINSNIDIAVAPIVPCYGIL